MFDQAEAKKFLASKEEKAKEKQENERKFLLDRMHEILQEKFKGTGIEVFLVGSILQPHHFTSHSDVDIVLKNFSGDRFELWAELEGKIGKNVEIILFENCQFKEFVATYGLQVV